MAGSRTGENPLDGSRERAQETWAMAGREDPAPLSKERRSETPDLQLCAPVLSSTVRIRLPGRIREIFGGSLAMGHQQHRRLSFTRASNELITFCLLRSQAQRFLPMFRRSQETLAGIRI